MKWGEIALLWPQFLPKGTEQGYENKYIYLHISRFFCTFAAQIIQLCQTL